MHESDKNLSPSPSYIMKTIFQTSHRIHRQFETNLSELDIPCNLTGTRLRFLLTLAESGRIRMNEMACKLGIQARTVTQFVDALETENLIVRIPDPSDRRAIFLQLTDQAIPILATAKNAMNEAADKILAPLSMENRNQLLKLLMILIPANETNNECVDPDKQC